MSTETDLQTVPVHVVNARELAPAPARSPDIAIITRTFTLKTGQTTGNDSVMARILDRDPNRTQAIIVAQGNPVYLCHSSALAEAAVGDSAGGFGGAQDGFVLPSTGNPVVLYTTDPLWAAVPADKAGAGAIVTVITERRRA